MCLASVHACGLACVRSVDVPDHVLLAHQWLLWKPAKGVQSPGEVRPGVFPSIRVTTLPGVETLRGRSQRESSGSTDLFFCALQLFSLVFLFNFLTNWKWFFADCQYSVITFCVTCLVSNCNEKHFLKVYFIFLKLLVCKSCGHIFNKRPKWFHFLSLGVLDLV